MSEPTEQVTHRSGVYYSHDDPDRLWSVYRVWLDWRPVMLVSVAAASSVTSERVILIGKPDADVTGEWLPTGGRAEWNADLGHIDQRSVQSYVFPRRHRLLADLYVGPRGEAPTSEFIDEDSDGL